MKSGTAWLLVGSLVLSGSIAIAASQNRLATVLFAAAVAFELARQHARRTARLTLANATVRHDEHLAQTAHELRTPLTSVLSALELVRSGYATTAEEVGEFLDEADLAAHHLAYLVNDVLDASALQAGRLRLDAQVHDVASILADAKRVLAPSAVRRDLHLQFPALPPDLCVFTDARRCLQVLLNLLGNALKFSPPGATVSLQIEPTPGHVRFLVVDAGPGVPAAARHRLFTAFGQVHADRSIDGTGLGLHITQQLVHQLGGSIGYVPGRDGGSVFWFELPRHAPECSIAPALGTAR